jgi:hypothetical protein
VIDLNNEAVEHAQAMIRRYEAAVARHPRNGPLSREQRTQVSNLAHWRRRLASIKTRIEQR